MKNVPCIIIKYHFHFPATKNEDSGGEQNVQYVSIKNVHQGQNQSENKNTYCKMSQENVEISYKQFYTCDETQPNLKFLAMKNTTGKKDQSNKVLIHSPNSSIFFLFLLAQ